MTGYLEMELHNKQKHNGFLELAPQFSVPLVLHKFKQLLNNKVHHTDCSAFRYFFLVVVQFQKSHQAFIRPVLVCVCSLDETA